MVEKVYSHLGTMRHRSEQVEYGVEPHEKVFGDRLTALRGEAAAGPEAGTRAGER